VHLEHLAGALRNAYPDELLEILVAEKNIGNSTYDGIELGAERVTKEIEDHIAKLKEDGKKVEKLSITGYSLGGVVARYVIGLLYTRGVFDTIQPMVSHYWDRCDSASKYLRWQNFTTFATPHLGARTPLAGWHNDIFNNLGGRTLSTTGTQLFLVDSFRETSRPLLAVMADPNSIFARGLSGFKRRSVYANIVNDRAVPFYTAFMSKTDPFVDLDAINIHYIPGYDNVILDASKNLASKKTEQPTYWESIYNTGSNVVNRAPMYLLFGAVIPIGATAYLVNAGIQSWRSAARIKLHEDGNLGASYRLPLMIEDVQRGADLAMENVMGSTSEEYLEDKDEKEVGKEAAKSEYASTTDGDREKKEIESNESEFPTLALTPEQFDMIDNLGKIGFEKFAVHIQKASHSHAAIVVRTNREAFSEGRIVFRHWTERFEL